MGRKKQLGKERRIIEQTKQIQNQRNYKRNALIIGAGSLIGCAILGYNALYNTISKKQSATDTNPQLSILEQTVASPELQEARINPEKRQAYLDNLLTNSRMPYVSGVIYDKEGTKLINYVKSLLEGDNLSTDEMNELMSDTLKEINKSGNHAQTPEIFEFNGQGIKPPIFVRSKLFQDKTLADEEIKHIITVHEARHAEQFAKGLNQLGYIDEKLLKVGVHDKTIAIEILYGIDEIDALNQELLAVESGNSKVSRDYYKNILRGYKTAHRVLASGLGLPRGIQRDLIESALRVNPKR
jgi:hypothetical protein